MTDQQEPKPYRNRTAKIQGAVRIAPGQPPKGIPVKPGEVVWLNADERQATANAPKSNDDNPFANGAFEPVAEVRASDIRAVDVEAAPAPEPEPEDTREDDERPGGDREEPPAQPPATPPAPAQETEEQKAASPQPAPAAPPAEDVEATAKAKAEAAAAEKAKAAAAAGPATTTTPAPAAAGAAKE